MQINVIRYKPYDTLSLRLHIHNGGCFETLNLLHVSGCKMFTFCDDLRKVKQNMETNSQKCTVQTGNHL